MSKYTTSKLAEKDLTSIWQYTVANWSQEQANKYVGGLLNTCSEIATAPEAHGQTYEHVRAGYRKYAYGRHVIFYKVLEDGNILISRILHKRMDFDRHL